MEEEEAALKKQLEACKDFDDRRGIREKLRQLRKKKLEALEADTASSGRRSRTRRQQRTVVETTSTEDDGVVVRKTRTTKTEIVENGDDTRSTEEEKVVVEEEAPVQKEPELERQPEPDPEPQPDVEPAPEPEQEAQPEPEPEPEAEEPAAEEEEPAPSQKNPEDLTEDDIVQIDDLEYLEAALKQLPLSAFEIRKHLRTRIRKVKVNKGTQERKAAGNVAHLKGNVFLEKKTEEISKTKRERALRQVTSPVLEKNNFSFRSKKESEEEELKSRSSYSKLAEITTTSKVDSKEEKQVVELNGGTDEREAVFRKTEDEKAELQEEFSIENFAIDTLLDKLDDAKLDDVTADDTEDVEKKNEYYSEDESSTTSSRSPTSSTSDLDNTSPRSPPITTKEESTKREEIVPKKTTIGGKEKIDFRGQLKKTRDISVTGKITAFQKKKDYSTSPQKVDFRNVLKSTPGSVPLPRKFSGSDKPSIKFTKREAGRSTEQNDDNEEEAVPKEQRKRRISSADLFNMLNKSKETKDVEIKQKGVQKPIAQSFQYAPPKIETKDESFESLLAQRKKDVKHQHSAIDPRDTTGKPDKGGADFRSMLKRSGSAPVTKRKGSSGERPDWSQRQLHKPTYVPPIPKSMVVGREGGDEGAIDVVDIKLEDVLNAPDVAPVSVSPSVPRRAGRKISSGNIIWVDTPQIDIKEKGQLELLRQQLEQQKRERETASKAGVTTEVDEKTAIEPEGKGTKEVTTRVEKKSEMHETDGGGTEEVKTTTEKITEVHKGAEGSSTTVTKTTRTTEVKSSGMGKAGVRSIEAQLAQKRKERISVKQQVAKDGKNKRMAFKEQLEAQNPKPQGGAKRNFGAATTAVGALLEWCRRRARGHEGVEIQNFTTSWADGLAMCAIFHNFSPDLVPYETLDPKNRTKNWTIAFEAAYAEGIDPLLELEDVLRVAVPEPRSLITYVHSIYQHFHDKAQKEKEEKEEQAA